MNDRDALPLTGTAGAFEEAGASERTMVTRAVTPQQLPLQVDARQHYLLVLQGAQVGRRVAFGKQPLVLGRKPPADVMLVDTEVSSRHCEVAARGNAGDAQVTDLQSTNGTFVDGKPVQGSMRLANGARLQIGGQVFLHEFRSAAEIARSEGLEQDLEKANRYVQSLLPPPVQSGPVRTDWFFQPSAKLGGDAFGYYQLDEHQFAGYLIDVSGHGAGAAMHSVSVMNVLRQRALPDTDFGAPEQVLKRLNDMFQMESHAGMYFSIWYGVFDARTRCLRYASGGHHPAYLVLPGVTELMPLKTRNLVIGAMPEARFVAAQVQVPPGGQLHVFSDGVFEIITKTGQQWDLPDLLPLLQAAPHDSPQQAAWLHQAVTQVARDGPLDDDFSVMIVTFL